jgi:hypothetical protein
MAKLVRIFSGLLPLLLLAALPVFAYTVALKDRRVIQFQKYRATETALLYVDDQGKEISILLDSIDLDRTRELNTKENPPLNLPGLITTLSSPNPDSGPSLGEIARNLRASQTAKEIASTSHTYTSDDFAPGAPTEEVEAHTSGGQGFFQAWRSQAVKLQAEFRALEIEPEQEAIKRALGSRSESRFPERDSWERRFLLARGNFFRNLQMCMSDRASDSEEKPKACSGLASQQHEYEALKLEGIRLATYWDTYQLEKR